MADVTRLLGAAAAGDPVAAAELLPLVYDELRKLAAVRMAEEKPGQTLQATALVHEAYVRLVGGEANAQWNGRGHFFAAAAEAMRRILMDNARRQRLSWHCGVWCRVELDEVTAESVAPACRLSDFDEVLSRLQVAAPLAARLVELRYFASLTMAEAADALGITVRTAERNWTFARAWLHRELSER